MHLESSNEATQLPTVEYLSGAHQAVLDAISHLGREPDPSFEARAQSSPPLDSLIIESGVITYGLPANDARKRARRGGVFIGIAGRDAVLLRVSGRYCQRFGFHDGQRSEERIPRRKLGHVFLPEFQWFELVAQEDLSSLVSKREPLGPWRRLRRLAILEAKDIRAVILYSAALGLLSLAAPIAVQALVNSVAFAGVLQPLVVLSGALFVGLALAGSLLVVQSYLVEVIQRRVMVRLAEDLGQRLPRVSAEGRDSVDLMELNNRFFDIITIQKTSTELLLTGSSLVLQTGFGLVLLASYHPFLMLFSFLLLCLLAGLIVFARGGLISAQNESKAKFAIAAWLDELAKAPEVFATGTARRVGTEELVRLTRDYVSKRKMHFRHILHLLVGGVGLQVLSIISLLVVGGFLVIDKQLTLGQLIAAEIVLSAIALGLGKFGKLAEKAFDLAAAVDKVGKLLDLPMAPRGAHAMSQETGLGLSLSAVEVGNEGLERLGPIDLEIPSGASVVLRSNDELGLSALLESMVGLRQVSAGDIRWNGRAHPRLEELGERSLLVTSHSVVAGSIMMNLRLGRAQILEQEAWDALDRVGLARRIEVLGGLHAPVLSDGMPLSADERSRLLLARCLVSDAQLLIVDCLLDSAFKGPAPDPTFVEHFLTLVQERTLVIASQGGWECPNLVTSIVLGGGGR